MTAKYACTKSELSCLIGSLFTSLEPPCSRCGPGLVLCGTTHSGNKGTLIVEGDTFSFDGDQEDIAAVRRGLCLKAGGCRGHPEGG